MEFHINFVQTTVQIKLESTPRIPIYMVDSREAYAQRFAQLARDKYYQLSEGDEHQPLAMYSAGFETKEETHSHSLAMQYQY